CCGHGPGAGLGRPGAGLGPGGRRPGRDRPGHRHHQHPQLADGPACGTSHIAAHRRRSALTIGLSGPWGGQQCQGHPQLRRAGLSVGDPGPAPGRDSAWVRGAGMKPVRVLVVVTVLAGGLVWALPAQADSAILLADVAEEPETTPTDPEECGSFDYSCRVTGGGYQWVAGGIGDVIEFTIRLAALPALATPPPPEENR